MVQIGPDRPHDPLELILKPHHRSSNKFNVLTLDWNFGWPWPRHEKSYRAVGNHPGSIRYGPSGIPAHPDSIRIWPIETPSGPSGIPVHPAHPYVGHRTLDIVRWTLYVGHCIDLGYISCCRVGCHRSKPKSKLTSPNFNMLTFADFG